MDPAEKAIEENRRLRRTMRDMVALSTLPAVWTGLSVEGIVRSLADVLLNTLSLDFIYVRLRARAGEEAVEVVRSKRSAAVRMGSVPAALAPFLNADQTQLPATILDPFGDGTLHVAVTRLGAIDDQGILVCGSSDPDFPTEQDRLLLGVGANQTAIVVQRRRAEEQVHEQLEWLQVTLASIGDAVIATDTNGRVTYLNAVAEELTGWTPNEAEGKPLETVFPIFNVTTRLPVENPVERVLREGIVVGLANHTILLARDGTERPIDDSAAPIRDSAGKMLGVVLIFRDVTEQRRLEQHRNIRLAVTSALSDAASVEDAARSVLRAVCENLGWDVGFFWTMNDEGSGLSCRQSWHRSGVPVDEFEADSYSRTFIKGQGLLGRVWASGQPAWIIDIAHDGNFSRRASAVRHGFHSAFACPVTVNMQMLGEIEFFTKLILEPDANLLEMMATVAGSLGLFIERKSAEDELRHSEQELADFFENATVGLHWVGPDGMIVRTNRTELDMLGYSSEEYVGRHIADFHADEDVIFDILKRLHEGERLIEYPARLKCKDGSIKDVLIDSSVMWRDGQFVHTRCFTRNITERKKAEARVHEQEQRTRTILESINDAFYALDRDWRFTYVNRQAEALLGRQRDDLIGKHLWDEYPAALGTDIECSYRRAVSENVTVNLEYFYPPHDRWYDVHAYPSPDGLSVYFRDVSERKRAEAALRESEERFRSIFSQTIAGVAQTDTTGRFVLANQRYCELVGRPIEELTGLRMQDITHRDDLPRNLPMFQTMLDGGPPFFIEKRYVRPDGSDVWVNNSVSLIRDGDGRPRNVVAVTLDITEKKQAEAALRESEQRLRLALDAGRMGVWDWNVRTGDLKWSDSLEPLHGLPSGTFGGTFEHFQQLIHPDDRDAVQSAIRAALESAGEFYVEFRNLRPHGAIHWIAGSGKVFYGEDAQPLRMIGIGLDVTRRKRAEQTARFLADASAALAVLVDFDSTLQKVSSLAVPSFADWATVDLVEPDGSLRRVSVSHMDPAKVQLARDVHRRFPPDPAAPQGVWNILRTGRSEIVPEITDELLIQSANDDELLGIMRQLGLNSYIGVPLTVRGRTLGVISFINAESGYLYDEADLAVAEDLASRAAIAIENAQLYRELRDADQRKDEFLATLAHELRNPLAPVRNALQILKMPRVDAQTIERSLEMMERQVQHLVRLVDDLMDVSRVMRGKIELRRERIELAAIVARAVEAAQPLVDAQGHELSVRISSESLLLDADPVRLAQVVGNLLTNAAKYTDANGRIWMTAEQEGKMAVLRVRDNGIGIAPPMLPRIFELFVQVDHASTKAQGGLGIGLTLVKNLVEMHSGTVEVRSEGLGRGSEFIVRLPVVVNEIEQDRSPQSVREAERVPLPSGHRLLVVDDNQDAANSLAMLLKLQGHEVRVAFSGMGAVEMTKTYTPDVVFMDIGMPGMDGYEAARRIREQPGLGKVVMAALTGWGQQEDRRRTAEAGFNHHLVKPPEPVALESVLSSIPKHR